MNKALYTSLILIAAISCKQAEEKADHHMPVASASNTLMLNDTQIRLANITTQKVALGWMKQTSTINGKLVANENQSNVISSRAAGRIEKLYLKETGKLVRKGEPLYELYSETLLGLQREYLLAKEQAETLGKQEPRYNSFVKAAEAKLILYGLTKSQISQLNESKLAKERVIIVAPASGLVTEIKVTEGQYVPEGGELYTLDNIQSLWLEAELYPTEAALVNMNDEIEVRVTGYESADIKAKIIFLSPEYRNNSQITIMLAVVDNPGLNYKPGMQAQVFFTHSSKKTLAIPADAVIRDEKGTHVYVQTEANTFEPRMVKTGMENFDQVEITSGLQEGEVIVASGAYLLYSEFILKKGSDPMASHGH